MNFPFLTQLSTRTAEKSSFSKKLNGGLFGEPRVIRGKFEAIYINELIH
jgi:hypothetical protein